MNILALDIATVTGFAHTNGRSGTWRLGKDRCGKLRQLIIEAHGAWHVDLIAVELATYGSKYAASQKFHNELLGVVKAAASEIGAQITGYHPTSIKKFATGHGRAPKQQVVKACKTLLGLEVIDDNEADAIWIREMAKAGYKTASKAAVAKRERRAIKKLYPKQLFES